ncbi:MAG: hypothetical protein WD845_11360 [Pirellulales bacterium]
MRTTRAIALVVLFAAWLTSLAAQEPAAAVQQSLSPREFLKLFDVDEARLAAFTDGHPLEGAQRDELLDILYRLRRYPLAAADQFSQSVEAVSTIAADPSAARGQMFLLAGRVTRVERVLLDEAQRERLLLSAYYRCTFVTDQGPTAEVCALHVPAAWQLDEALDERASARAMFLKLLPANEQIDADAGQPASAPLLFVAQRVAWHPDTALGKLGMDYGLFDDVRDKTGLDERETFYQLLASVRRADDAVLRRTARQQLAAEQPHWQSTVDAKSASAAERSAARRSLERAAAGASDVVPLFNDPAGQRGKLVTVQGEALRAIEIRVDDPDIVQRFGIRRYYEVEMLTDDSQNNPVVCCVAQLPPGMPLGNNIHEGVRVTGFFLKSWGYRPGGAIAGQHQLAPLIVAGTLSRIAPPAADGSGAWIAGGLLVALVAAAIVMFFIRRADRRAMAAAQQARTELPERLSLESFEDDEQE